MGGAGDARVVAAHGLLAFLGELLVWELEPVGSYVQVMVRWPVGPVAVLGAGGGRLAVAYEWASQGHRVSLYAQRARSPSGAGPRTRRYPG